MNILEDFRDAENVFNLVAKIKKRATKKWTIMEICGGQTHSIIKNGLDELLADNIEFIHGPGCPVCVTDSSIIDFAIYLSFLPDVVLCTFGDMLRVPGEKESLAQAKAKGGKIQIVYSPLDAVTFAEKNPQSKIIFFGVGFETTAPANALAVYQAQIKSLKNFYLLAAHVLVPPALEAILTAPNRIDAFLLAGHVCTIMGEKQYHPLAEKFSIPLIITGFEPVDILLGVLAAVDMCEQGRCGVINQYERSATSAGNVPAQKILQDVFEITDRKWRGLGNIASSGLTLKAEYAAFDAEKVFNVPAETALAITENESNPCLSGAVLCGEIKPTACPHFGKNCTPMSPLGPTMVSSEGACAAYYAYRLK